MLTSTNCLGGTSGNYHTHKYRKQLMNITQTHSPLLLKGVSNKIRVNASIQTVNNFDICLLIKTFLLDLYDIEIITDI